MIEYSVIILAAGTGSRMGFEYNKVLHKINDKIILDYSIEFFENHLKCKDIVLVCNDRDYEYIFNRYHLRVSSIIIGGSLRQYSVRKGLDKAIYDYVLVHDSARPFINSVKIDQLIDEMVLSKATTLAVPVKDSIVKTSGNRISKGLDRKSLFAIQTPQAFLKTLLIKAHDKALNDGYIATDDTELVRMYTDVVPTFIKGDYRSVKLTTKEDIEYLEVIL